MECIIIYIACYEGMEKRPEKNKNTAKRVEDIKYCRVLREFLKTFKTVACSIQEEHRLDQCPFYHSHNDRRRNPYTDMGFLYYLDQQCYCDNPKCPRYHSHAEYVYHPHIYKTSPCNRIPCDAPPNICWMLHKGEFSHFEQGQFFRFDITTFKTMRCTRPESHDRKVCLYYHYEKDRRRPNFNDYSHILCHKTNCNCSLSHNKIEQLYHPTRYKTKFCQHYGKDPTACEYRDFCSFAHTKDEILITLIDPDNKDPAYIVNMYKTVWCPQTEDHDRGECPYAHNIQDFRRKPSLYHYEPIKCPKWDFSNKIESIEASECPQGMNCKKCHGWMEHRFHPLIFKPKSLQKGYIRKEELIEKKLKDNSARDRKEKEKNNIEAIISKDIERNKEAEKAKAIYSVGAPFFKSQRECERDLSDASYQTKPKSGKNSNLGSETSVNASSHPNNERRGLMPRRNLIPGKISSVFFESAEHQIWECDSIQYSKQRNSDGRSRSQGTSSEFDQSYSRSIKELVNDSVIINKLYSEKINENMLISMGEEGKVNGLGVLSTSEKDKLLRKLREYHLCKSVLKYSLKLTNFFAMNNAEHILNKLRLKKHSQERILKLTRQAVKDLSFLTEEEKDLLPKLLRKYLQGKQYDTLIVDVEEFVNKPTGEAGDP